MNTLHCPVEIIGVHTAATESFRSAALGNGALLSRPVKLVVTDSYLSDALDEINKRALDEQWLWMLVRPSNTQAWIGPFFEPGGPCWRCLADRLRTNGIGLLETQSARSDLMLAKLNDSLVAAMCMRELVKIVEHGAPLRHRLLTFGLEDLSGQQHPVSKVSHCAACGGGKDDPSIVLQSVGKGSESNGYRTRTPEETLQRLSKQISPITGIISSLSPTIPNDAQRTAPPQAYVCKFRGRPWRPQDESGARLELSFGKGASDTQAKVSCLAEAVERYCGAFNQADKRVVARYGQLQGAVHPHQLLLFSEQQYANRDKLNRSDDLFNWIPHRFDDSREIEWTAAWSLRDAAVRYVPSAYCFYYYPDSSEQRFCIANSNGCASGNTLEEAVLLALFELIERDCVGIWWYNRLTRPAVDVDSFDEPYLRNLIDHFAEHGRCLRVIDLTNDISIPTFAAVSWREEGRSILFGTGTHIDAKAAITRAISELNQRLPFAARIDKGLPVSSGAAEQRIAKWLKEETIETQPYLKPHATERRQKSAYAGVVADDLLVDINAVVGKLHALGLDTIVLDMSKPEFELPTVRVIVPGLRHSWARFAPGRLYDVPVAMGWQPAPFAEHELNPIAYFV